MNFFVIVAELKFSKKSNVSLRLVGHSSEEYTLGEIYIGQLE